MKLNLYPRNFISEFFDISNFDFQIPDAYTPGFKSGFPHYQWSQIVAVASDQNSF